MPAQSRDVNLTTLNYPDAVAAGAPSQAGHEAARPIEVRRERAVGTDVSFVLFCVLLPLATVLFELYTRTCATNWLDPLPTPLHVLLVLTVPLGNFVVWRATRNAAPRRLHALGLLNGVAIGTSLCYALLFLPFLPFAFIALIFFGAGLLPMGPMFGLIGAFVSRERLRYPPGAVVGRRVPGIWPGMLAAVLTLAALALPQLLTAHGMQLATTPATRDEGVRFLRTWGNTDEMLQACYWGGRRELARVSVGDLGAPVDPDEARQVFYRVTGTSYDAHPAPVSARFGWVDGQRWDDGDQELRGGTRVGGLLNGLSLASSHVDGSVNADAATAYFEWTMEFRNDRAFAQEARCRIELPPGGVVSRLTLWINGEPREAAFGGRVQVREAYEQVVKVQRRDPVLVTTAGPDRVQMQCFPVPPGGLMKVRLGVTAPLELAGPGRGGVRLPCFADRNFAVPDEPLHDVWVRSRVNLAASGNGFALDATPGADGGFTLRGTLRDAALLDRLVVTLARDPAVAAVSFADPYDPAVGTIVQRLEAYTEAPPPRVVLAIDGSAGMSGAMSAVADALHALPQHVAARAVVSCDGLIELEGNAASIAARLKAVECRGGQDSVPALARAWDVAARQPGSIVVWVHGPQPILLESTAALQQRFDRTPDGPGLLHLQVAAGHDEVVEQLANAVRVRPVPATSPGGVGQDLRALFDGWSDGAQRWRLVRTAEPAPDEAGVTRGDIEVVRLWANEQVARMTAKRSLGQSEDAGPASALAVRHHLVTPVSGAVVLETQAQYDAAGLSPVTAIPLPPAVWMALLMAPFIWWLSRRATRAAEC